MPLKEAKKRSYNKRYYVENKEKIADKKKTDYQDNLEKSRADSAARSRKSYMKGWKRVVMTVLHEAMRAT